MLWEVLRWSNMKIHSLEYLLHDYGGVVLKIHSLEYVLQYPRFYLRDYSIADGPPRARSRVLFYSFTCIR